ncbi:hypothetical protein ACWDTR_16930 [Streptomyces sp. NPDC003470]
MTVRHVDHGAPSLRLVLPLALLGPAFFLSSYLLSVGWDVPSGCRAAVVGLAATVTAWLASTEWLAGHPAGRRTGSGAGTALAAAALPCAVLLALSVALLHRGDSAGVWALIPVVALIQAGVLLRSGRPAADSGPNRPAGPGGRVSGPASDGPATPPGTPTEDPGDPAAGSGDPGKEPGERTDDPGERGEEPGVPAGDPGAPANAPDDGATRPERPPLPATAAPDTAGPTPPGADGEPAPDEDGEPGRSARRPEVGIDAELWRNLAEVLAEPAERREEQGGVALTARTDDGMWTIVGAVLPQQTWANAVRCEFSVLEVERVRDALDSLGPDHRDAVRITWLHTHPGLSVFLSSTDHDTSAKWRALDPDFRPVVVDVTKKELGDRIGVFDARGAALPIGLVDDVLPAGTAGAIRDAVLERYRRTGGPLPLVLVGAEPYRT